MGKAKGERLKAEGPKRRWKDADVGCRVCGCTLSCACETSWVPGGGGADGLE